MKKAQGRSASSIITAFTQLTQRAELAAESQRLQQLVKTRKQRKLDLLNEGKPLKSPEGSGKDEAYRKMIEHKCPIQQLYKGHFGGVMIDPDHGLQSDDVRQLQQIYGPNRLTPKQKVHWIIKIFHEMTTPFSLMFWGGALLCFIAYGIDSSDIATLYLGVVLAAVTFITGLVTFFQNSQSEAIMETLLKNRPQQVMLRRNGAIVQINPDQIVPGDIVIINKGDKIPADIRMIKVSDMQVDNSALTGESDLQNRSVECTNQENALETKNVAFFSTNCGNGRCEGIVFLTGDATIIGQIANLASNSGSQTSPLRIELNKFIIYISIIAVFLGVCFFIAGFILGYPPVTNFLFAIGILVANIPEGLLVMVTAALSVSAKRLYAQKGVETLGSTSCICSDKTGTLTQNQMTVENMWNNAKLSKARNKQKYPQEAQYDVNDPTFKSLHECGVVCSQASFNFNLPDDLQQDVEGRQDLTNQEIDKLISQKDAQYKEELKKQLILEFPTYGDATQSGLIKFFHAIEDISVTRARFPVATDKDGKQAQLPFNSSNKFAYNIVNYQVKSNEGILTSQFCLFSQGAPERIWSQCTKILVNGEEIDIDQKWQAQFKKANQVFGGNGQRVLGFAQYHLPQSKFGPDYQFDMSQFNFPDNEQVFCGLISLIDPPRDAVPYSVLQCQAAGIQVIMVTGDQQLTAASIAKQINIINKETVNEIAQRTGRTFEECIGQSDAIVISGDRLAKMMAEEEGLPQRERGKQLQEYLMKPQIVFARTSPAQKLIIVEANQKIGHIVAVTGDGVNDSPAIKQADIGVAMGIAGTEVTKDAADMILMNDDFSSIVLGIEEGRQNFDNLKKALAYILASNIPELWPFLLMIIAGVPLALSTVLILCVCLGTDLVPAISISYEEAELDIMVRKPRSKEDGLANGRLFYWGYNLEGIVQTFGCFFVFFIVMADFGFPMRNLWYLNSENGVLPEDTDIYDPDAPDLGNSNLRSQLNCTPGEDISTNRGSTIDWLYTQHSFQDLRMAMVECVIDQFGQTRYVTQNIFGECKVKQISPITHIPVCYTTESLRYAQTAFFVGIVITQISNACSVQTRQLSLFYQGMSNQFMLLGFASEICLCLLLTYVLGCNVALGTRDLIFIHYGIPSIPFAIFVNVWEQFRKFLVRNIPPVNKYKANWFERNTVY